MLSNAKRAAAARSMPSPFEGPDPAPMRKGPGIAAHIHNRLLCAGAALLLAAAPLGAEAGLGEFGYYTFPAAQAAASDIYSGTHQEAYDLNLMTTLCGANHVRSVNVNLPTIGFASAQAGKGFDHFAMAGTEPVGAANSAAGVWVQVNDPEDRQTVKLNLTIQAYASAPNPYGAYSAADYALYVGRALDHTPHAFILDDGCTVTSAESIATVPATPLIFAMVGYDSKIVDLEGNVHTSNGIKTYRYGAQEGESAQSYAPMSATFEVEPNRAIVVVVRAGSAGGGMAVIDPVITAHPDNPDVTVEISYVPDGDTGRRPLDGFTAQDVAALGIDPQPFINLGFLSPSSEPPPPPPPAPPKDWCSPGFWLNNAVKFGARAWPVSAPIYSDYNSTSGRVAGCPVANGNPTLLQVLQNPGLYFSNQLKGVGFNCIGDYLSAQSGLFGTQADNDGLCSIDQFGRHIQ